MHSTVEWLIPLPVSCFLFSQFLTSQSLPRSHFLFKFGFPLSSAACSCLFIQSLLVISHPPQNTNTYAHKFFVMMFFSSPLLLVPAHRRLLFCLCYISLDEKSWLWSFHSLFFLIRYGYNCVIYGWDPACMMGHEWIRNMNVHSLPHGPHQPFYNVLVEDGSCRYAAQGERESPLFALCLKVQ